MTGEKSCSKCREKKGLDDFYYSNTSQRFYSACRKCHSNLAAAANRKRRTPPQPSGRPQLDDYSGIIADLTKRQIFDR